MATGTMAALKVLVLLTVLGNFGLVGCISNVGTYNQATVAPSQEILDGTIRNPADWNDPPRRTVRRTPRVTVGSVNAGSGEPQTVGTVANPAALIFSEEWFANERRESERLNPNR